MMFLSRCSFITMVFHGFIVHHFQVGTEIMICITDTKYQCQIIEVELPTQIFVSIRCNMPGDIAVRNNIT